MATVVTFNDRNIIEPGVYSQIKANVNVAPTPQSFGNVMIIDTGDGAGFGGGSGITGELANGLNSVYGFDTLNDFRQFVRGGLLWDLAEYLFIPVNGAAGAPKVFLVKAATTIAASGTYTLTNGTFKFKCKNEGAAGNGVQVNTTTDTAVRQGYGSLMKKGIINPAKYIFEFYEGTFKGNDSDGDAYDGAALGTCVPKLIARSAEVATVAELILWAKADSNFNARFALDSSSVSTGTGAIVAGDYIAPNNAIKLCTGGTTTYASGDLDTTLSKIGEVDYTLLLSLKNAGNAQGSENTKSLYHITQEAEFKKFMILGGGNDETAFSAGTTGSSIDTAAYFNSQYAVVCHSGFKITVPWSSQPKLKSSVYHAAMVCGRLGGLLPQTSITFKGLRARTWRHQLTKAERETALQAGVLHNRFVPQLGYVVNQGINSLQRNTMMVNPDGSSAEISIMRIAEQLNKELVLNMRPIFVGQNLNTASPADVKAFVEGYLSNKTATKLQDNLIISFEKVVVTQTQDYYQVTYNFVPNSPLNKIFVTGFIIDANLSA
jgi:hypothetical protein